jgi:hypothetical protein
MDSFGTKIMSEDWKSLAKQSHYETAQLIQKKLDLGEWQEAYQGIEELVEALGRSEKRALRSQLVRLMMHVIKWKSQPYKRSPSWVYTIASARMEIEDLLVDEPSLRSELESLFETTFPKAKRLAEAEMNQQCSVVKLTWEEVFEEEYYLD